MGRQVETMEKISLVDHSLLTPISQISGEDDNETKELHELYAEAKEFLLKFRWCTKIKCAHLGYGVGGVLGVFYIEIEPDSIDIERHLWVIVGDIPSAYIVIDKAKSTVQAIRIYIKLFREWVEAIKTGASVQGLMPANAPPTLDNAILLESRLIFLEKNIVPYVQ